MHTRIRFFVDLISKLAGEKLQQFFVCLVKRHDIVCTHYFTCTKSDYMFTVGGHA